MTPVDHAKAAAGARSNLNAWGAVVAMLEGGVLSGDGTHKAQEQVIKIAQREMRKHLKEFDAALAALKRSA